MLLCNDFIVLPQVITNPNSTTIVIGQSAQLICEARGSNLIYQWMKDNEVVSRANSNILKIKSANESDTGMYRCVASNKGGMADSYPATVTVYGEC